MLLALGFLISSAVNAGTATEVPPESRWSYRYAGSPMPLTLDEGSLAITNREASSTELLEGLRSLGLTDFRDDGKIDLDTYLFSRPTASAAPVLVPGSVPSIEEVVARVAEAGLGFVQPLFETLRGDSLFFRARVLAKAHPDTPTGIVEAHLNHIGTIRDREFGKIPRLYRVEVREFRSALELLDHTNALADAREFEYIGPVAATLGQPSAPTDPEFTQSWNLHNEGQEDNTCVTDPNYESGYLPCQGGGAPEGCRCLDVNAPEAWAASSLNTGDANVIVAVLDTGVDDTPHPDLPLPLSYDFTTDPPTPFGGPQGICDNHGTPVAGVIFGLWENAYGSARIAPGLSLASGRWPLYPNEPPSLPGTCSPTIAIDNLILAIEWAEDIGAVIINLSWNFNPSDPLADALRLARHRGGITTFVSAGNAGPGVESVLFPATLPTVNAVSNLDFAGSAPQLFPGSAVFTASSRGPEVDFTAPGTLVFSTDRVGPAGFCPAYENSPHFLCPVADPEDAWEYATGTSFASPLVAGIAGLIISRYPSIIPWGQPWARWGPEAVEWVLRQAARDLGTAGWDYQFGWGLPLANRALEIADELASRGEMIFFSGFESGNYCSWGADHNGSFLCTN